MCLGSHTDGSMYVVMVIVDCQWDKDHVRDKSLGMSVRVFVNWVYWRWKNYPDVDSSVPWLES